MLAVAGRWLRPDACVHRGVAEPRVSGLQAAAAPDERKRAPGPPQRRSHNRGGRFWHRRHGVPAELFFEEERGEGQEHPGGGEVQVGRGWLVRAQTRRLRPWAPSGAVRESALLAFSGGIEITRPIKMVPG